LEELRSRLADINALRAASSMMEWDQQTYMPPGGAEARSEHLGRLSKLAHELFTSDETLRLIEESKPGAAGDDADMLRVVSRDAYLATKLPTELVEEKSRLAAVAHEEWVKARKENDFKGFASTLERMFDIARQEAELLGYTKERYDALLDLYEEGATAADARVMFEALKEQVELVHAIAELPEVDDSILYGNWSIPAQKEFTEFLVKSIGFDMQRGRQDTAPHPFCSGWSRGDVRLTTRYGSYLPGSIFGSLHEAGHGMYEQGTPAKWDLTPLAGGVSLGLHESQSRTWENLVGRSLGFWEHFFPSMAGYFPELSGLTAKEFYRLVNKVKRSFIRTEADELTYNLHVMTRFEIESDILDGRLAVKDLPEAWNAKYQAYLGITPETDSVGCLQDVHWSMGSIGYFPTYSMGNLLSYQIWAKLENDLGDSQELIQAGRFEPILGWLQEKIYTKARQLKPKDLVLEVTGKPMGAEDYLRGLGKKYRELYEL